MSLMSDARLPDGEEMRSATGTANLKTALPALLAIALSVFVAITTELLPVGLLEQIGLEFDRSFTQVGVLVTIYAAMVAILSVPLTIWTKRVPRKQLLLLTLVTFALSSLLVAVAPNFAVVALGRAFGGISHALFFAIALGYPARLLRPSDLGKGLSITTAGMSLGFILGVPLATGLGVAVGWRWSFVTVGILALLLCAVVAKVLPAVPNPIPKIKAVRPPGSLGAFTSVQTVNLLMFLGQYTVYTYISPILSTAGASQELIAPLLLIFGAMGVIGLFAVGTQIDVRPRKALFATIAGFIAGLLLLHLSGSSLWATIASASVWCIAFGAVPVFFSTASIRTGAMSPDLSGAWINSTANVGIALGAVIGAYVIDSFNIGAVSLAGAAIIAVCAVVVARSKKGFPAI